MHEFDDVVTLLLLLLSFIKFRICLFKSNNSEFITNPVIISYLLSHSTEIECSVGFDNDAFVRSSSKISDNGLDSCGMDLLWGGCESGNLAYCKSDVWTGVVAQV